MAELEDKNKAAPPTEKPPAAKTDEQTEELVRRRKIGRGLAKDYKDEKKDSGIASLASRFVGDIETAPSSIAFWVIVLSFVILAIAMVEDNPSPKIVDAAISFIAAALGFLFGQRTPPGGRHRR